MRRLLLIAAAAFMAATLAVSGARAESEMTASPVQAVAPHGSLAGHFVAIGIGAVAGVVIANAALPAAWGWVASLAGGVAGGTLGNLVYGQAIETPLLHRSATMAAEVPSLLYLATHSDLR